MWPVVVYAPTPAGGHARYVHELLSGLVEVEPSWDLTLATSRRLDPRYRDVSYRIDDSLPFLHPFDTRHPKTWFGALADRFRASARPENAFLRARLDAPKPVVVHLQEYHAAMLSRHIRALRRHGDRVIVTVHNVSPHRLRPRALLHSRLARHGWADADALIVHTDANAKHLRRVVGGDVPIHVVGHGLWRAATTAGDRKPRTILFFGVTRPNKGLHVLLEALRDLPDVHLVIAGPLGDAHYERRLARALAPVHERVTRVGRYVEDDELGQFFGRVEAVVMPYVRFGAQSGVLYLALAHGVPVVVSRVGGLAEPVEAVGAGLVVRPNDVMSLRHALARVLDPAEQVRLRANIATNVGDWSWSSIARRTVEVYASAIGSPRAYPHTRARTA